MPLRIGFDVDGVVADFNRGFRNACGELLGTARDGERADDLSATDLKRVWRRVIGTTNWWMTLEPYEPAQIERLYKLARRHKWEVFFLTKRPQTEGDSVQFQTQWWIEHHGFYLPSVLTLPGSRGDAANALRLDVTVDDQLLECADIISSSTSKALLMLREADKTTYDQATSRAIGVVSSLEEAIDVVERLQEIVVTKGSSLIRLTNWFSLVKPPEPTLPMNPRATRPLPDADAATKAPDA
jgi:hypothetical protein